LGTELPDDDEEEDNTNDSNNENTSLRWIAITNFWERDEHGRPSRGGLLMDYLDDKVPSAKSFLSGLQRRGHEFNGFNLLVGDKSSIYYYGNRMKDPQSSNKPLSHGIYGLGNGLLDSLWPKVERGEGNSMLPLPERYRARAIHLARIIPRKANGFTSRSNTTKK